MHENRTEVQRVILVAADLGEYDVDASLDELAELADTAGAEVVGRMSQRRSELDAATCIGAGRLQELHDQAQFLQADLVIFDHELSASQLRNIEDLLETPVIDRTMLILDIFAQRAASSEGKLQVELAQQRYLLPRLTGLGRSLSRLGGGIGTRGPGETKLETDRRHIRRRIQALERQLEELTQRRERKRERRRKDGVLTAAIVGYTNVGKSTLLNALTGAQVFAQDQLFATLDPTARAVELPDGRSVLLVDTVGFLRRLPHHLIEAFQSTLEEALDADIILNVCDISSPDVLEQRDVTETLLAQLGVGDTPVLTVYNKCDVLGHVPFAMGKDCVPISARTGQGFDTLLDAMARAMSPTQVRLRLLIPYASGNLSSELRDSGHIFSEEYTPDGIKLDALVDKRILWKFEEMILPD